jgi:L-lactate dehydrogenase complex protein LldG
MDAREAILTSIRKALATAPPPEVDVPRSYRDLPVADDFVDLFVERVEDYRATVTRTTPAEAESAIRAALGEGRSVVVPDGLGYTVVGAIPDRALTHEQLDAVDAVVTEAALGIASTGTIVLEHGRGQGRRALSLVPDLHVCIVRESQVVGGVPQAVAALDPARPQTWISGPSATSDIELDRVEGVHGPRSLHVVLVSDSPQEDRDGGGGAT